MPTPCLRYWCFFRAAQAILDAAAVNDPSQMRRVMRGCRRSFCPTVSVVRSCRSARSSAAEEDARDDLEYYAAEDDEREEAC